MFSGRENSAQFSLPFGWPDDIGYVIDTDMPLILELNNFFL